ncbi:MAG: hypothetical protein ACLTNK_01015, partial [Akkermansia muciniphila]
KQYYHPEWQSGPYSKAGHEAASPLPHNTASSTINILLLTENAFHNNMVVLITTENEINFLQDTEKYRSAGTRAVS